MNKKEIENQIYTEIKRALDRLGKLRGDVGMALIGKEAWRIADKYHTDGDSVINILLTRMREDEQSSSNEGVTEGLKDEERKMHRGLALIIANDKYKNVRQLPSCTKDGADMAKTLGGLGFDVITAFDLGRSDMYSKLSQFLQEADAYSTVLVYYSGHGVQIDGNNYLVPVDYVYVNDKRILIDTNLVSIEPILDYSRKNTEKTSVIILDACRDAPNFDKTVASSGLAEMNAGGGAFIAYATAPNRTAAGSISPTENSVFTENLLKHIEKPNKGIEELFRLVRRDVEAATGGAQIPWESTSLMSSFYFNTMEQEKINDAVYLAVRAHNTPETLISLSDKYGMSVSDVMRVYSRKKSERPGGIRITDPVDFEGYLLQQLLKMGFEQSGYRWVYKGNPVTMGEIYHNPEDVSLEPNKGEEITVTVDANMIIENKHEHYVSGNTNLPVGTNLLIGLSSKAHSYRASSPASVDQDHKFRSQRFMHHGVPLVAGKYILEISMPIASVQPEDVKRSLGKYARNLSGQYIKKDIILGKTLEFSKVVVIS